MDSLGPFTLGSVMLPPAAKWRCPLAVVRCGCTRGVVSDLPGIRPQRGGRWGGGDEGTRTPDPRDANAVLSQLSYIPTGRLAVGGEYSKGPDPFPK